MPSQKKSARPHGASDNTSANAIPIPMLKQLTILLLLLALLLPAAQTPSPEFLLQEAAQAEARAMESRDPQESSDARKEAIEKYEALLEQGFINGPVLEKLGELHLLQGEFPQAILALDKALLFNPRSPSLRDNLAYARRACNVTDIPGPSPNPLKRFLGFSQRTTVAIALAWAALLLGLLARHTGIAQKPTRNLSILAFALATLLTITLLYDYHQGQTHTPAVVATQDAVPRKGPGEAYQLLQGNPLPVGTELAAIRSHGKWTMITLHDGQTAWIPQDSLIQ